LEFLDGGARTIWAEALGDARVRVVSREALQRLEEEQPGSSFAMFDLIARLLSKRLRLTNDLYKREILRGIESSGAQVLDLQYVLRDAVRIEVALKGGERFTGRIVLMAHSYGTYQMTILDDEGGLVCIPYGSVSTITAQD
jgi:CRP-like cAMP-binding protein